MRWWPVGVFGLLMGWAVQANAADVDHAAWDRLLHRYVQDGRVDYAGLAAERKALEGYAASLANVEVNDLPSRDAQLAFWINAYNAVVVQAVLQRYPLRSVRQVGGFFDGLRYQIAGRRLTLNDIEGAARALGDWRSHFAVVCASSSCPPLRSEAYVPQHLDAQLAEQTRRFLKDSERGLKLAGNTLWVSKIFNWYPTDFVPAGQLGALRRLTAEKLLEVLEPYLDRQVLQAAHGRKLGLKFLDYDWVLNGSAQGG